MPAKIAPAAVGSYPAFSPLPLARRFVFCCTVRTRALRRAPRPFGRNPALWCPDFPPADEPRANARPKFSKNSPFGIGGFGISESLARFSPRLKGCGLGLQAQSRTLRKIRPDRKSGISRTLANSPAVFAPPNPQPLQNRENAENPDGKALRKGKFARNSAMQWEEPNRARRPPCSARCRRRGRKGFSPLSAPRKFRGSSGQP